MRWLGLVVTLGLAGCTHWVELGTPLPQTLEQVPPPKLRLATRSGESMVMTGARLQGDSIAGLVERQSGGEAVLSAVLGATLKHHVPGSVLVRDVLRVDVRRPDATATAALAVGIGVGIVVFVLAASQFGNWFEGSGSGLVYRIAF